MTHTYAVLEVSARTYAEVRARLEAAGYDHAFHKDDSAEVIDLHGIAIKREVRPGVDGDEEGQRVEFASILSRRTKRGMVNLTVNNESAQLDVRKAKEIHRMLGEAIEAAISDELIYTFLTVKAGFSDAEANRALLVFRELRQGDATTVRPH